MGPDEGEQVMLVAQFPDRVWWPLVDWSIALLSALGLLLRGARVDAVSLRVRAEEHEFASRD